MNHSDIRHKLSEYIDETVTPDEKAAIEAHIVSCAECTDALRELRKTIEQVKQLEEIEAPAWMTSKIMAKVRVEAKEKKGLLQRLFFPLAVKVPLEAVAVLFLTITAYYIYTVAHPAGKYAEAPFPGPAGQEPSPSAPQARKEKSPVVAVPGEKKVEQSPGYRSLDMKDEYERPAPPVQAKPAEEPAPSGKAGSPSMKAFAPRAAEPMMAEQALGAARSRERKQAAVSEDHYKRGPAGPTDSDREAEEQLSVSEYFVKHDLEEASKVKGLQFIARKVPDDLSGLEWLRETAAYRSVPCDKRYIVDVELPGRSLKYLYCYDRTHIRRLGVFELTSGVWVEQR